METLERLHAQLEGLDELRTIVKTMKALSAANIRQFERAVAAVDDYYGTIEHGLQAVLRGAHRPAPPARAGGPRRLAAIVFGSDHGLCGRFNESVVEHALERLASVPADRERRYLLAVGGRAAGSLEHAGETVEIEQPLPASAAQITATVQRIVLEVDEWREHGHVHYVLLFYNRRRSGRAHEPTSVELLPLDLKRFAGLSERRWPSRSLPAFTMERARLLGRLLHQYLFISIFRACAESQASEHASRLTAMQAAQRNLDERVDEVTGAYRRARQDAITSELLDVVAGFEATGGGAD